MEGKNGASRMLLLLYGMLILALLVLAAAEAKLCGAALGAAREHDHRRTALAFIQSRTAACEGSAGAYLTDGPEGAMLCLPEAGSGFETRIYLWQNTLRSELTAEETADPENGEIICALEEFDLSWQRENLLRITADGLTGYAAVLGGDCRG